MRINTAIVGLGLSDSDTEVDSLKSGSVTAPLGTSSGRSLEVETAPKLRNLYVPLLPKPPTSSTLHTIKFPAVPEEFPFRISLREMERVVMETRVSEELEKAMNELDAAKAFAEKAAQSRAMILWRNRIDASGTIVLDASGNPVR